MRDNNIHIDFQLVDRAELDRKRLRKAFVTIGKKVQATARSLVNKSEVSKAGEYPGKRTGKLAESIGYKVPNATKKRPGLMVIISPNQKGGKGMKKIEGDFYPAFLRYGVKNGAKRGKSHKKGASGGTGWKIAPRKNFMEDALNKEKTWSKYFLSKELVRSIKKVKE